MSDGALHPDGDRDLRLRSRELRIALAAVIGTVVIGLAGPMITWRASATGQQAAIRQQRVADDLAELRSVFDRSLGDLLAYEAVVRARAWAPGHENGSAAAMIGPASDPHHPDKVRASLALNLRARRHDRAVVGGARLRLRLGSLKVVNTFMSAQTELDRAVASYFEDGERALADYKFQHAMQTAIERRVTFTAQGEHLIGSQVPLSST